MPDRDVLAFGWRRNEHPLGAGLQCPCFSASVNSPVDSMTISTPSLLQGKAAGLLYREATNRMTVHHQVSSSANSELDFHCALPPQNRPAWSRIEQVKQDCPRGLCRLPRHVTSLPSQALLNDCTKYQRPIARTVNSNFGHDGWSLNKVRRQLSGHRESVN